jgi:hypothetical protein
MPKDEDNWAKKLKKKVQKHFAEKKKKAKETTRTRSVKKQLRGSLSEADIKRLQDKKKKK